MRFTLGNLVKPYAPPPPSTFATYNPADKAANIALTGGNLVATKNTVDDSNSVRGTNPKTSGKYYFEVLCNGTNAYVGIANASTSLNSYVGLNGNSIGYLSAGNVLSGGVVSGGPGYGIGDRVRVAVDIGAQRLWISRIGDNWNAAPSANPATGVGGISTVSLGATIYIGVTVTFDGDSMTLNAGASAFTGTVPAGYTGWPT